MVYYEKFSHYKCDFHKLSPGKISFLIIVNLKYEKISLDPLTKKKF